MFILLTEGHYIFGTLYAMKKYKGLVAIVILILPTAIYVFDLW